MRRSGFLTLGGLILWLVIVPGASADECLGLLPAGDAPGGGTTRCVYEHVPFATFSYTDGNLRATWPEAYEVLDAQVVEDWVVVSPYVPGSRMRLPIHRDTSRYDVVARFRSVDTGETFNGLTPIWCVRSERIPAPLEGCFGGDSTLNCALTETVACATGGTATITCDGDTGTCKSCSTKDTACCESTKRSTTLMGGIVRQETVIERRENSCVTPQLPKPGAPESPGLP